MSVRMADTNTNELQDAYDMIEHTRPSDARTLARHGDAKRVTKPPFVKENNGKVVVLAAARWRNHCQIMQ